MWRPSYEITVCLYRCSCVLEFDANYLKTVWDQVRKTKSRDIDYILEKHDGDSNAFVQEEFTYFTC